MVLFSKINILFLYSRCYFLLQLDDRIEYEALRQFILKKYEVLERLNKSFMIAHNEDYLENGVVHLENVIWNDMMLFAARV